MRLALPGPHPRSARRHAGTRHGPLLRAEALLLRRLPVLGSPAYTDNLQRLAVDARAVASGRRRASLAEYRSAQAVVAEQRRGAR